MVSAEAFYRQLKQIRVDVPVAVATIIEVRGSVPRELGTKMIIHPLGQHVGTVGGGCGEADVIRTGLDVIETGQPRILEVDLTEEVSMDSLGVCGGIMRVFVDEWSERQNESASGAAQQPDLLLDNLIEANKMGREVALATVVRATDQYAAALGRRLLVGPNQQAEKGNLALGDLTGQVMADVAQCVKARRSQLLSYKKDRGSVELFVDVQRAPATLLIVGAGHVALPVARLGKMLDFEVVVLDDRPKYANTTRFPMADEVVARPFREALQSWPIDNETYIVLVTRGHSHDVECLLEVLDSSARYIGMIGSKRRIKAVFELLQDKFGIDPVKLDRVYAPVGLDLGAETPAEIAVAIMAEVINLYRGGRAVSLSDALRTDRRLTLHPARVKSRT